jgi:hypothetical protein
MSWFTKKPSRAAVRAAAVTMKAPILVDGGVSVNGATIFKANIGHGAVKHLALLFAVVVADSPEEATELLLKWSKSDSMMHAFISSGSFILEEISPHRKGVL